MTHKLTPFPPTPQLHPKHVQAHSQLLASPIIVLTQTACHNLARTRLGEHCLGTTAVQRCWRAVRCWRVWQNFHVTRIVAITPAVFRQHRKQQSPGSYALERHRKQLPSIGLRQRRAHARTHARTHAHTHTYIYTHTHARIILSSLSSLY